MSPTRHAVLGPKMSNAGTPKLEDEEAPELKVVAAPKRKDLLNELDDVKTKWKAIGRQLEVPESTLITIEKENKDDTGEALASMLHEWEKADSETSWREVVNALRAKSVKEYKLAKNLELNRCPLPPADDNSLAAGVYYIYSQ